MLAGRIAPSIASSLRIVLVCKPCCLVFRAEHQHLRTEPSTDDTSLDVGVESFYEWDVDMHSLKKTDPDVDIGGMKPTSNLEKYIQRKLFSLKYV